MGGRTAKLFSTGYDHLANVKMHFTFEMPFSSFMETPGSQPLTAEVCPISVGIP